ncbi:5-(carboxyamino)imidazole ribonucleotide synthase [Paracrocinitomix mangrovi]|uniref:5-(carboxyamino)imidazole ribonucleotide synthase n=1 Tax=Paracrocinitomix mangrovi TaxID=2862509 RepID=UPI001C8D0B78|nr:5-(carboxyamino)imidazole ribonucleotide synthase [Paracrocinitomix mangrovi]UKN01754.1 5-(carboxyamino)imidazole ribonucleotide synthase [Paracrocinitomix mangrovi]
MNVSFSTQLKIGILGGGQLGRMIYQEAINLGIDLYFLDAADSPCSFISPNFKTGTITNYDDVYNFGKDKDVITIEIENVNVEALFKLKEEGVAIFPEPEAIQLIQDKGLQKQFYQEIGVPTAPFKLIDSKIELHDYADFPVMQKMRKGGYDGKGVQVLRSSSDIEIAFEVPSVLENFVDLDKELSVIVARDVNGNTKSFPVVEQEFNAEANLVEFLFSPADIDKNIETKAQEIAEKIIRSLNMTGLLAVEFFLSKSGELFVNEIAPRPHNSGHQTIEGNYTSQFEQHLRSISGLPLGETAITLPSVMVNLLGEKGSAGEAEYLGIEEILSWKGVNVHVYGKKTSKPFRKMGHITVVDESLEEAKNRALKVKETIKVVGKS